jgi:hypothetical protein
MIAKTTPPLARNLFLTNMIFSQLFLKELFFIIFITAENLIFKQNFLLAFQLKFCARLKQQISVFLCRCLSVSVEENKNSGNARKLEEKIGKSVDCALEKRK